MKDSDGNNIPIIEWTAADINFHFHRFGIALVACFALLILSIIIPIPYVQHVLAVITLIAFAVLIVVFLIYMCVVCSVKVGTITDSGAKNILEFLVVIFILASIGLCSYLVKSFFEENPSEETVLKYFEENPSYDDDPYEWYVESEYWKDDDYYTEAVTKAYEEGMHHGIERTIEYYEDDDN